MSSVTSKPPTNSGQHSSGDAPNERLSASMGQFRTRLRSVGLVAALGWMVLVAAIVLLLAVWFDLLWELSATARIVACVVAGGSALVAFGMFAVSVLRRSGRERLAAHLDEVAGTGGEIKSGLELADSLKNNQEDRPLAAGLASLAVSQAADRAGAIDSKTAVSLAPLKTVAWALAGVGALIAVVAFAMPQLAQTQWNRFLSPLDDTPPFSTITFDVTPGDIEVRYGDPVDIVAQLSDVPLDDLELVLISELEENVPMFSEGSNRWKTSLFRVTEPMKYQVRSGRLRSKTFSIDVVSVPEIDGVEFLVTPPAYTRLGKRRVKGGMPIRALAGTQVQVLATSNRPLSKGTVAFAKEGSAEEGAAIELLPSDQTEDLQKVVGSFEVKKGGKFVVSLTDVDGVESNDSHAGYVELLKDTRPFVRIIEPKQNSWATSSVQLPVQITAEDDYGLSRVAVYRSLNDSRPLPLELPLSDNSCRFNVGFRLPLRDYLLTPGDKLELFVRVEDNDPAEAKGSESPIHSVFIISHQQFMQMQQQEMGIESVLSKYRQIERQLESLEMMQDEIKKMNGDKPPEAKPTDEVKGELESAAREFERHAMGLVELMERKFPVDVDRDLEERIVEMQEQMREIAKEMRDLIRKVDRFEITNEELEEKLKELREKLHGVREEFDKDVMRPMDDLAKLFPLLILQEQFSQIVLRQRNLSDRLKSLADQEEVEDAATKRRMRDLAEEQGRLEDALDEVLLDIEKEALSLPIGEEYVELRDSSIKFSADVIASGAFEQQEQAETALNELSGADGFRHAEKAAEILESFIEQAQDAQDQAMEAGMKRFKPMRGMRLPKLGDSIAQMMKMFGPKNGSQHRGQGNRGVYGDNPRSNQKRRAGGRGNRQSRGGSGGPDTNRVPVEPDDRVQRHTGEASGTQVPVPLRYERKSGEYYRRIIEELGDE